MKAALVLLALSVPAHACDWKVAERVDPMTDQKTCTITSPTARIGLGVRGQEVTFVSMSPLRWDYLTLRVDDNPAIQLAQDARSTSAFKDDARVVLSQILAGQRLRTSWRGYPNNVEGEAEICNLPELIRACGS